MAGVPHERPIGELAHVIARAIGIRPTRRSSYFRAGEYYEFDLGGAELYLQRNHDPDDGTAPYGNAREWPFILDMWEVPEAVERDLLREVGEALGARCPVLERSSVDLPFD